MAGGLAFVGFLVGFVICAFVGVAAVVGGAIYLIFTARSTLLPGPGQIGAIIEEWARTHGYEVLRIDPVSGRDHPFADRFGAGFGKRPAVVRAVEVRTPAGRRRKGWVYIAARGYHAGAGFRPESLEVAWAE